MPGRWARPMAADDTAGVVISTATGLAVPVVAGPVEGPGRVDVAREDHGPPTALAPGPQPSCEAGPLGGVAVPLVVVEHPAVEDGVAVREQRVDPAQRARPRELELVHHDAAGDHGPRSARRRPAARPASAAARRRGASASGRRGPATRRRPPAGRGRGGACRAAAARPGRRSPSTATWSAVVPVAAGGRAATPGGPGRRPRPGPPRARARRGRAFLAPSRQALSARSWSSQIVTIGWRRCRACASGSARTWAIRRR